MLKPLGSPSQAALTSPPDHATSRRYTIALLVCVLAFAGVLGITLNRRFERPFDWNTAAYSIAARNIVRDGFVPLHGGVYLSAGDFPRKGRIFYGGHPPLLTWLLAGWMALFGQGNAALRAMPVFFTTANLCLLFLLVRRTLGPSVALLATVLYALLPMTAFYAQMINMEPLVVTAMLCCALAYQRYLQRGDRLSLSLMLLAVALGCWVDWPMFVFAALLAGLHVRGRYPNGFGEQAGGRGSRPAALGVVPPTVAVLLLMGGLFCLYTHLNDASATDLLARAAERTGLTSGHGSAQPGVGDSQAAIGVVGAYQTLLGKFTSWMHFRSWFASLFTPPAILLAFIGAALFPWHGRPARVCRASSPTSPGARTGDAVGPGPLGRILLAMALTQFLWTVAFPEGATRHDYWQYYLGIPIAVLAAVALACAWAMARHALPGLPSCKTWHTTTGRQQPMLAMAACLLAAMVPVYGYRSFRYRIGSLTDEPFPAEGLDHWRLVYVQPLRQYTTPRDLICTDYADLGYALPWYADRMVTPEYEPDVLIHPPPDRRTLFLWLGEGDDELYRSLEQRFGPPYRAGPLTIFLISGQPDPRWIRA